MMRPSDPEPGHSWWTLGAAMAEVDVDMAHILAEPAAAMDQLDRVCIVDAEDDTPAPARALVLLAGVRGRAALPSLRRLIAHRPAAIAVKGTADSLTEAIEVLRGSGCGLVAVAPATPWDWLDGMIRQRLGQLALPTPGSSIGSPDLFAIAQTAATLTHAHVVIEDPGNRVLAYSPASNDVDELRRLSILARRGPEPYQKLLKDLGIYEQLHTVETPVHIAADPEHGLRQRVAIGIRAGSRMLGYIWLQEGAEPLAPHVDAVLTGSARQAAVELLRQRSGHSQAARPERIRALLGGAVQIRAQARAAGIDAEQPAALVLLRATDHGRSTFATGLIDTEVASVASVHAAGFRPTAVVGAVDGALAVILPELNIRRSPAGLQRLAKDIVTDAQSHFDCRVQAAIGPIAGSLVRLPETMPLVRGMLGIMAAAPERSTASFAELESEVLVGEVLGLMGTREDVRHAGLAGLGRNHPELALTLATYLENFGDVLRCAEVLSIHRNTVHYRLRRACELSGIHLGNADHRLLAHLQLRLAATQT